MEDIRKGRCPLCDHHEIIEAFAMDLAPLSTQGAERSTVGAFAAAVTHSFREDGAFASHGKIRRYVCRRCGFLQSFADDPGSIPIDHRHGTRVLAGAKVGGPYR